MRLRLRYLPVENVKVDGGAGVADVAEGVGGDAANVHADLAGNERLEDLLLLSH